MHELGHCDGRDGDLDLPEQLPDVVQKLFDGLLLSLRPDDDALSRGLIPGWRVPWLLAVLPYQAWQ
jgi:hypothetical protein